MVAKALATGADEVVLDLEDAVAPDAKEAARATVVEVLAAGATPSLAVRVNQVGTPWCHRDVLAVAEALAGTERAVTLVVPKVESAADVGFVERLVGGATPASRVSVDVLVESAPALRDLHAIVSASPLVRAVVVGYADLAADLGRDPGTDPTLWDGVRHQVVVAARAAGRALVDGPWLGTAADEAFSRDRSRARALGFDGTWVIHPSQVEEAARIYSPSAEQVERARQVVSALEASVADGTGAVALDGQMLDEAVAVRARAVLARAEALG
jgi:citrate lyase subunit beta/citryl-CoA lyase